MVSNVIILSSYSEIHYIIIRFHLRFVYIQSILTQLNVHMTDNPTTDSPQNDDQTQSKSKANDGK